MTSKKVSVVSNTVERVEDEYDGEPEDEYASLDEGYLGEPAFEQDGPGLFDEPGDEEPAAFAPVASSQSVADHREAHPEVAPPPLALYRRYRPDSFAEVIGQDHVTVPLMRALDNNRVNHAYLFSGPRGCGKTTSARILARCLNCEQGPTSTPCGVCRSCQDLARGGPGSIDVIEIDAASHGGVEDARDLRERAFFAPVHSRYKIYIVDEAHMVTTAGFNALLRRLGCEVLDLGIVPDSREATRQALREAAEGADLIISAGGVSVGEEDHVRPAVEAEGQIDLWRVAIKPGRPLAYGRVGRHGAEGARAAVPGSFAHFIGLPGNPVSAYVTFLLFVVSQGTDNLQILDATDGKLKADVKVGAGPLAVVWEPVRKLAYVANRGSDSVAAVDVNGNLVANLPGGSYANHVFTDGKGTVWSVNKARGLNDPQGDHISRYAAK